MSPDSIEERMTRVETEVEHVRELVGEIRQDLKELPLQVRKQVLVAGRRQRRDIQADTEHAIERCQEIRDRVQTPSASLSHDWEILKHAVIGLVILGAVIGGIVAGVGWWP